MIEFDDMEAAFIDVKMDGDVYEEYFLHSIAALEEEEEFF